MAILAPWLPGSLVAKAVRPLLDQQFFCWGEDIKHPQGNMLIRFGFRRQRAEESRAGCSRYHLTRADGSEIVLWGGGFLLSQADGWGIAFNRAPFRPRLVVPGTDLSSVWTAADIPILGLPQTPEAAARSRVLLADSFSFIAGYERWVADTTEPMWRSGTIDRWWKPRTSAPEIAARWQNLSEQTLFTGAKAEVNSPTVV